MKKLILMITVVLTVLSTVKIGAIQPSTSVQMAPMLEQPKPIKDVFPDPTLAIEICEALNKISVEDVISQNDLDVVKSLNIGLMDEIRDLTGLRYFRYLEDLGLGYVNVSNLDELSPLIRMKKIHLAFTKISDLSGLANLVNLEDLTGLFSLEIEDISFVTHLKKLKVIHFMDVSIQDISPLANLENLEELYVMGRVKDPSPIMTLTNLKWVELEKNAITDLRVFQDVIPSPLDEFAIGNQKIELDPITRTGQDYRVPVEIYNVDGSIIIPNRISNGGYYENGEIIWKNIDSSVNRLSFEFDEEVQLELVTGSFMTHYWGEVKVDLIDEPLVITADPLLELAVGSNVDESQFLELIHASVSDGISPITTNFSTSVDKKTAGEYIVELNATDGNQVADSVYVSVKVKELAIHHQNIPVSEMTVYVGEPFVLTANLEQNQGAAGWRYDETYYSTTFNSPATFTPLQVGQTKIGYVSVDGLYAEVDVTIVEREVTPPVEEAPSLPNTGQSSTLPIIGIVIIGIGLMMSILKHINQEKRSEK